MAPFPSPSPCHLKQLFVWIGGFPELWNGLPDLYALDMNNNNLSGELPSAVDSLTKLETFSTEI